MLYLAANPLFMSRFMLLLWASFIGCCHSVAQGLCSDSFNLVKTSEKSYPFPQQSMTSIHDANDRDFVYVASMEKGLVVLDISTPSQWDIVAEMELSDTKDADAMSLTQSGNFLYLALGNSFTDKQAPGLAIVDITDPNTPIVRDVWQFEKSTSGGGIVKVQGDYAYLGAMGHGLIVLDISNKDRIEFVSQLVPSIKYPNASNPDPLKYNARGMDVHGDLVYLCYDAGGLRIINVKDKKNPRQTGRYSLPALDKLPRAYNNVIYREGLVYVAIDYCGLEVLDVSDTASIEQVYWLNPWDCTHSPLAWFSSKGHTNEMALIEECQALGISTGKSEMILVDISDPMEPVLCDSFGSILSKEGTWGISAYEQTFYLSYIHVPLGVPFKSNWAGIRAVELEGNCKDLSTPLISRKLRINTYVQHGQLQVEVSESGRTSRRMEVYGSDGKKWYKDSISNSAVVPGLPSGIYLIRIEDTVVKVVLP